jgi:hypothetical protein
MPRISSHKHPKSLNLAAQRAVSTSDSPVSVLLVTGFSLGPRSGAKPAEATVGGSQSDASAASAAQTGVRLAEGRFASWPGRSHQPAST